MLTSLLGIRLILLVGKTVPLPASYDTMAALSSVEVTNDAEQGDGFQITFTLSKDNPSTMTCCRAACSTHQSRDHRCAARRISPRS